MLWEPWIRLNRAHSYSPGSREGQQDLFHPFHLGCPGWNEKVINLKNREMDFKMGSLVNEK